MRRLPAVRLAILLVLLATITPTPFSRPMGVFPDAFRLVRPRLIMPLDSTTAPKGFAPRDLWAAYGLGTLPLGSGWDQTVALVEAGDDPTIATDVARYRTAMGLPALHPGQLRVVNEQGEADKPPAIDSDWAVETALDAEMVSALCPHCQILIVEADSSWSVPDAQWTAYTLKPAVVSDSWGMSEPHLVRTCPDYSRYYGCMTEGDFVAETALLFHHPGIVTTVSSGDDGYGVSWPADSPDVVAVGGTSLVTATDTTRGYTETAWGSFTKKQGWWGAGSGCSYGFPKPSWQIDRCRARTVADVSFVADPQTGVAVYDSTPFWSKRRHAWRSGWVTVGGTSVGAPAIAALYALAGNARYLGTSAGAKLYAHPEALFDVTTGTDAPPCACWRGQAYLRRALPGFDGPSGMGTPDGLAAF